MGFGIHAYGTGWIYNVSGLLGVEIELKGGSFIRLGTDQPNYLIQAIEDAKDKGILSSTVDGEFIFPKILEDLKCPGKALDKKGNHHSYKIYSFVQAAQDPENPER